MGSALSLMLYSRHLLVPRPSSGICTPKHTQGGETHGNKWTWSRIWEQAESTGVSQPFIFISISFAELSNPAGPGCAEAEGQGFALELSQLEQRKAQLRAMPWQV